MISISEKQNCCGCKACYNVCPRDCIDMVLDHEGFWYPKIDENKCIKCGKCREVCPEIGVYNNAEDNTICLAAWNKNESIRRGSSSGGVFTALAKWVISEDGVVFGAGYDENLKIIHKAIYTIEKLEDLRGSKYVQSDINNTYNEAKRCLQSGRKVLFTGTPCQIAGLYKFLQKEYEELYTCDLVCHGVPSPKVFKQYKCHIEKQYDSSIQTINFRNKYFGWNLFSVFVVFNNGRQYKKNLNEDVYMRGFLRNYYLRPSCYECTYAKLPRVSDITLADFWGVGDKYPHLDNNNGTSLLLINTNKGIKILNNCKNDIFMQKCDLKYAISKNPCIIKSVSKPQIRKKFFYDLDNREFEYVIKKYMGEPTHIDKMIIFLKRVLGFIKRKIKKIIKFT